MSEIYFTVKELSEKIRFKPQTLYNMIYQGNFVLGKHYLKPSPRKLLFKWSGIQEWLGDNGTTATLKPPVVKTTKQPQIKSLINI